MIIVTTEKHVNIFDLLLYASLCYRRGFTLLDYAANTGISPSKARRRIDKLREAQVLDTHMIDGRNRYILVGQWWELLLSGCSWNVQIEGSKVRCSLVSDDGNTRYIRQCKPWKDYPREDWISIKE